MSAVSFVGRLLLPSWCCCCCCRRKKQNQEKENTERGDESVVTEESNPTAPASDDIQTKGHGDDAFYFWENSHQMYVDVVNLSPKLFRHYARAAYLKGMHQHAETIQGIPNSINEEIMYIVVKERTPKEHLKQALETLDKDRTTPSSSH